MMKTRALIRLLRPLQWTKSGFVFLPMFFSGNLANGQMWLRALMAFVCFSMMAGGIYCINDLRDAEADRFHPAKRMRPVACGDVTVAQARATAAVLIVGSLAVSWVVFPFRAVSAILAVYLLLNVAYSFWLKHTAIVDVMIVAAGFVLRVLAGGAACRVWVSPWLICMTFLLALFIALAKRRDDVLLMETRGIVARKNIVRYTSAYLNQALSIVAGVTIMSYIMYTVSAEVIARFDCQYVYLTAVFVLAGILRYLQVVIVDNRSGSPTEILLRDRFIQGCIAAWLLTFLVIIYG